MHSGSTYLIGKVHQRTQAGDNPDHCGQNNCLEKPSIIYPRLFGQFKSLQLMRCGPSLIGFVPPQMKTSSSYWRQDAEYRKPGPASYPDGQRFWLRHMTRSREPVAQLGADSANCGPEGKADAKIESYDPDRHPRPAAK